MSAHELEAARLARKEQQREMREEILREAKESFENERKREELKRARGDDKWVLPAVKKRLGFKGEVAPIVSEKKNKKKKDKKHKKHKTSRTEKEQSENESEENEGEGEDMWVEKGSTVTAVPSASSARSSDRYKIHTISYAYSTCTPVARCDITICSLCTPIHSVFAVTPLH